MKKLSLVSVLVFFFAVVTSAQSETVSHDLRVKFPTYAFVGLSGEGSIELSPKAPDVAGEGLDFNSPSASNSTKYLQYSSLPGKGGKNNRISVSMTAANSMALPKGVTILLKVEDYSGKGKGTLGTPSTGAEGIVLEKNGKAIVTGIKNCYTGTGSEEGHLLTYSLKMEDETASYEDLSTGDYDFTITYTIEAE